MPKGVMMLSNHEKFAHKQLQNMSHIVVAKAATRRVYEISYIDRDRFKKVLTADNVESFFAIVEMLTALGRKFTYKLIDDTYIILRKK